MIDSKIVKEITLKFKADDKDVKKVADALGKGSAGGMNAKTTQAFTDGLKKLNAELAKTGSQLPKSAQIFQKAMQQVAEKDLKKANDEIDKMFKKSNDALKAWDRISSGQGSAGLKQKAEGLYNNRMSESYDALNKRNGDDGKAAGAGGSGGGSSKVRDFADKWGIPGGAVPGLSVGAMIYAFDKALGKAQNFNQGMMQREGKSGIVGKLQEYYDGTSMQDALIQSKDPTYNKRLAAYVNQQSGVGVAKPFRNMASGLEAVWNNMGSIPGALTGKLPGITKLFDGIGSSFNKATEDKFAIDRVEYAQQFQETERKRADAALYLPEFLKNAPQRGALLRRTRQGTMDALSERQGFADTNQMSTSEVEDIQRSLISRVGAGSARTISGQAGSARKNYGFDLDASSNALASIALGAQGGSKAAEENFKKIMSEAIGKGFSDSGLLEALLKNATATLDASGNRLNAGAVSDNLMRFIPQGADMKSISESIKGQEIFNKATAGAGSYDHLQKSSAARQFMEKKDIAYNPALESELVGMTDNLARSGGTELTKALGISGDELLALNQSFRGKNLGSNAITRSKSAAANADLKKKGYITNLSGLDLGRNYLFTKFPAEYASMSEEQKTAAMAPFLAEQGYTAEPGSSYDKFNKQSPEERKRLMDQFSADTKAVNKNAEVVLDNAQKETANMLDKKSTEAVAPTADQVAAGQRAAGVMVNAQTDKGGGELGNQLTAATIAVEGFTDALLKASTSIGNKYGFAPKSSSFNSSSPNNGQEQ